MSFYHDIVLPRLCHLIMRNRHLAAYRERVISTAEGRVLEVGIGSGLNLPFYQHRVSEILGLEPAPQLIAMARRAAHTTPAPVTYIEASAEAVPLDDHSVDTVVTTWTLCSIPEVGLALGEMRRVLRPGGRLLFVEHGVAPDKRVHKWQDRLTPLWKRIGRGCHLNRPMPTMIESAGFRFDRLNTGYMPGPRIMTFMYEGSARPC
jgi:ubiquinone/menaquinone biosynthesis C-methylase UbiE